MAMRAGRCYTHEGFKDVYFRVDRINEYKIGYLDVRVTWRHNKGYVIAPDKFRITKAKGKEFKEKS